MTERPLRESYREELDSVAADLVAMSQLVSTAVQGARRALLEADLGAAEQVISGDAFIDRASEDLDRRCFSLLARQAPVAGELRIVVAVLRMTSDLARAGDLAAHVAKIARMRYPEHAVPAALEPNFGRMADVAISMMNDAGTALAERDVALAQRVSERDEEMDDLRKSHFRALAASDWPHGVESAVDVGLMGRYFERIADHAVTMAQLVSFIVEGDHLGED